MYISFDTGELDVAAASKTIGDTSFGMKYTGFRNISRFLEQTEDIDHGMIHWPGGYFSETNDGRYGFEHKGLMNPNLGKDRPDLEEIFEFANSEGVAVAITLPTAAYQNNPNALIKDAKPFLEDLYSGEFGPIPDKLIIEIGNEYYGVFKGSSEVAQAADYAEIVNAYAEVIHEVEAQYNVDPDQIEYSIQIGRTEEASTEILEGLSDDSLLLADYLSHHRYPFEARGADDRIEDVADTLNDFEQEISALGGDRPDLFVSEYNTASLTRGEAANKFLAQSDDPTLTRTDLDLSGRSNREFEQFYQDQLGIRTYGINQAENVLQIFSEYQGIGAEAMTSYGWDSAFAGRNTFQGTDGEAYTFTGGAIKDMMAESLDGTRVLDMYQSNEYGRGHEGDVSQFGFASADKMVFFLVAPENLEGPMAVDFDLSQLGPLQAVWGESLTAETPSDWNSLFDVPVTPGVDQSNEADTYAVAERSAMQLDLEGEKLEFEFYEPGEVVRLTFARTDEGEDEIREWHGNDMLVLEGAIDDGGGSIPDDLFDFPTIDIPEDDPTEEEDVAVEEDEGGAEDIFGGLLAPLMMLIAGI